MLMWLKYMYLPETSERPLDLECSPRIRVKELLLCLVQLGVEMVGMFKRWGSLRDRCSREILKLWYLLYFLLFQCWSWEKLTSFSSDSSSYCSSWGAAMSSELWSRSVTDENSQSLDQDRYSLKKKTHYLLYSITVIESKLVYPDFKDQLKISWDHLHKV